MKDTKELLFEVENGVAIITFNRPEKRNSITNSMYAEMRKYLEEVKKRDEVKALVITGTDPAFCSGSDIDTRLLPRVAQGHTVPLEKTRSELLESVLVSFAPSLYYLGKPSIAAINGVAAGAGLSIALLCDIRIASDKSRFGAAWSGIGLIPDVGATFTLPRVIGIDRALELIFTGQFIDAARAEQIRLVTKVVPHDELMKTAMELALTITGGPSVAFELTKQAIYRGLTSDLQSQLEFESYAQNICFMTEDFKEGIKALLEKRKQTSRKDS